MARLNRPARRGETPRAVGSGLVWTFLAMAVGSVLLFRGHDSAWPLVGWTMYWRVGETPNVVRTIRIDVTTENGSRRSYFPSDPLTHVERPLVERVMWQSFDSAADRHESRRFLVLMLEATRPSDRLRIIEGNVVEWDVPDPPSLRRFSRDDPDRQIAVGSFSVENYR